LLSNLARNLHFFGLFQAQVSGEELEEATARDMASSGRVAYARKKGNFLEGKRHLVADSVVAPPIGLEPMTDGERVKCLPQIPLFSSRKKHSVDARQHAKYLCQQRVRTLMTIET